jgi:NADPH-dependent 2,4-dienoyl-CoA reductase/sulfur reductase-like enzyme
VPGAGEAAAIRYSLARSHRRADHAAVNATRGISPAALPAARTRTASDRACDAIVIGAGVFGAWTAQHSRRAGKRVLLVDKMGPANARPRSSALMAAISGASGRYLTV